MNSREIFTIILAVVLITGLSFVLIGIRSKTINSDGTYSFKKWRMLQIGLFLTIASVISSMLLVILLLRNGNDNSENSCKDCEATNAVWYPKEQEYRYQGTKWGKAQFEPRQRLGVGEEPDQIQD
jgi:hypothetical protein